jgi:hypothetical protein
MNVRLTATDVLHPPLLSQACTGARSKQQPTLLINSNIFSRKIMKVVVLKEGLKNQKGVKLPPPSGRFMPPSLRKPSPAPRSPRQARYE